MPASDDTLSLYVAALDRHSSSGVRQAIAAIRLAHERQGHALLLEELPATVAALRGHRRSRRAVRPDKATAATREIVRQLLATMDKATALGARNRALVLVGFDGGFRRSELVGLDVEHLSATAHGIDVLVAFAKGDQEGKGATRALLYDDDETLCPVRALGHWLRVGGRRTGPVFVSLSGARHAPVAGCARLSDRAVARVVQGAARRAGLAGRFSGHSLRRGMITEALESGAARRRRSRRVMTRRSGSGGRCGGPVRRWTG